MALNDPPLQQNIGDKATPQVWQLWFSAVKRVVSQLNNDGSITPVSLADADAADNSIYYSTDQNKLVYKDAGGTVNALY